MLERRQLAAPLAVIGGVGARVVEMRVAAGDAAVNQHDDAGRAPAPAVGHLRLHRVETVLHAWHGKVSVPLDSQSSPLPTRPRNPEFWRIACPICRRECPAGACPGTRHRDSSVNSVRYRGDLTSCGWTV